MLGHTAVFAKVFLRHDTLPQQFLFYRLSFPNRDKKSTYKIASQIYHFQAGSGLSTDVFASQLNFPNSCVYSNAFCFVRSLLL